MARTEPAAAPDGAPRSLKTADRLLETAAELFRRKGYAETTTRELAEGLGIRKATLYHHIRTKEDLLERLCLESLSRLTAEVGTIAEDSPSRLRDMITTHLTVALRDRDLHATMLLEHGSLAPERRAAVVAGRDAYERLLRDVVHTDQEAGLLRSDISAKHLTLALLNLLNWTIFWFDPDGEDTAEQTADMLAEVFLGGAARR